MKIQCPKCNHEFELELSPEGKAIPFLDEHFSTCVSESEVLVSPKRRVDYIALNYEIPDERNDGYGKLTNNIIEIKALKKSDLIAKIWNVFGQIQDVKKFLGSKSSISDYEITDILNQIKIIANKIINKSQSGELKETAQEIRDLSEKALDSLNTNPQRFSTQILNLNRSFYSEETEEIQQLTSNLYSCISRIDNLFELKQEKAIGYYNFFVCFILDKDNPEYCSNEINSRLDVFRKERIGIIIITEGNKLKILLEPYQFVGRLPSRKYTYLKIVEKWQKRVLDRYKITL